MTTDIAQIGGSRTEMLAALERLRARVVAGEIDGLMVLWDDEKGIDSDAAGVWGLPGLVAHLHMLAGLNIALWMANREED